jgi:hypothetical protein
VLNKTNNSTIIGLYGSETDDWIGKKIALFSQEVDFQGKQTMAIRIRMRTPKNTVVTTSSTKDVTTFWAYAKSIGIDQATGRGLVAECNGNFANALKVLQGEQSEYIDIAEEVDAGIDPSDGLPFGDK